jgi:hypothetical protein
MIPLTVKLFLGPPEAASIRADLIPVETASDAVTVIKCGHAALLPADGWDEAAAVLRKFGADEDWIEFRFRIAQGKHGDDE